MCSSPQARSAELPTTEEYRLIDPQVQACTNPDCGGVTQQIRADPLVAGYIQSGATYWADTPGTLVYFNSAGMHTTSAPAAESHPFFCIMRD